MLMAVMHADGDVEICARAVTCFPYARTELRSTKSDTAANRLEDSFCLSSSHHCCDTTVWQFACRRGGEGTEINGQTQKRNRLCAGDGIKKSKEARAITNQKGPTKTS
mmetsp:Transcript_6446/g.12785  ORF Transcript_6446/g.12785 Transcript_6446/m.12785 type:complete len:108 (-) Transcript_6446:212-535(-)